jgi:multidrug efflux pump subunit AcrB
LRGRRCALPPALPLTGKSTTTTTIIPKSCKPILNIDANNREKQHRGASTTRTRTRSQATATRSPKSCKTMKINEFDGKSMNNARKAMTSIERPMQRREKTRRTIEKLMERVRKSLKTMENRGKTLENQRKQWKIDENRWKGNEKARMPPANKRKCKKKNCQINFALYLTNFHSD